MAKRTSYEQGFWTEKKIQTLHGLWAEGHSTAEIGRRMGTTKNAIVSKAHRENLEPRESPILNGGQTAKWATPGRIEVMREWYPTYRSIYDIVALLKNLGGPPIPNLHTVRSYINDALKLKRPVDFVKKTQQASTRQSAPRPHPSKEPPAAKPRSQERKASTIGWRAPTGIAQTPKANCCLWRGCSRDTDDKWCAVHANLIRQPADKIVTKLATWR